MSDSEICRKLIPWCLKVVSLKRDYTIPYDEWMGVLTAISDLGYQSIPDFIEANLETFSVFGFMESKLKDALRFYDKQGTLFLVSFPKGLSATPTFNFN